MPNVKMPASETRDLTVDILLERIQSNFRLLNMESIDEAELKQDLEDLVAGLKEIGEEMMTEYRWLKDLVEEVRSEDGKARLLSRLQSDREQCLKTTTRIQALAGLVDGTENVVEVVYKITSARSMLGRVQNPSHQRSISQSLSKISVAQEKVFDGRNGLVELNGELDRRGLVAKLQEGDEETENAAGSPAGLTREAPSSHKPVVHEAPSSAKAPRGLDKSPQNHEAPSSDKTPLTVSTPSETGPRPENTPAPATSDRPPLEIRSARKSTVSGQTTSHNVATTNRSRSVQGPRPDDTRTMTPATADTSSGLSRSDAERAKRALNDWSRWNPLAPVNLGDVVRIVDVTQEEATLMRIQSLVGERKWRGELSRAHASPHLKKGESLWDLPASPPSQFASATEEGDYCETTYRPRHLEHLLYSGDVPPGLLREATGMELIQEDFSACKDGVVEAGLEERCLNALSKWPIQNEVSEHFKVLQDETDEDSKDEPESRIVRSVLHVESIPVLRLKCELELKRGRHYLVEAWLCGDEGKLHVSDVPKVWTWKTTAWLAAIATLGIPLGFLMASLV